MEEGAVRIIYPDLRELGTSHLVVYSLGTGKKDDSWLAGTHSDCSWELSTRQSGKVQPVPAKEVLFLGLLYPMPSLFVLFCLVFHCYLDSLGARSSKMGRGGGGEEEASFRLSRKYHEIMPIDCSATAKECWFQPSPLPSSSSVSLFPPHLPYPTATLTIASSWVVLLYVLTCFLATMLVWIVLFPG